MSDGAGMDYQTEILEEVRRDVRRISKVMFEGNGQPALLTRIDRLERWSDEREAAIRREAKRAAAAEETVGHRVWELVKMVLAAAIGGLVAIATAGVTL